MSFLAFAIFCFVLLLAAYTVVRARTRSLTCLEVVTRMKPIEEPTSIPKTRQEFAAMCRRANNLTLATMLSDKYRRAMASCSDRYSFENMQLVHATFERKRIILIKSLLYGVFHLCTGGNGKARVTIARHYDDVLMLAQEMAELMDPRCAGILEGHLLHGS